jgi:hypothetical protein
MTLNLLLQTLLLPLPFFLLVSFQEDAVHVVVDRNLVTGQNPQSSTLAARNFIWLLQEREGAPRKK